MFETESKQMTKNEKGFFLHAPSLEMQILHWMCDSLQGPLLSCAHQICNNEEKKAPDDK